MEQLVESIRIVAMCVLSAMAYGIIHDEITAHLCIEYFTVAHPHIFPTDSPTLLGLAWGVAGTWWIGLLLGAILAFVSRRGTGQKERAGSLAKRVGKLFVVMALAAAFAGALANGIASTTKLIVPDPAIPVAKYSIFYSVWAAHLTSYAVGIIGGLLLILSVWRRRCIRVVG